MSERESWIIEFHKRLKDLNELVSKCPNSGEICEKKWNPINCFECGRIARYNEGKTDTLRPLLKHCGANLSTSGPLCSKQQICPFKLSQTCLIHTELMQGDELLKKQTVDGFHVCPTCGMPMVLVCTGPYRNGMLCHNYECLNVVCTTPACGYKCIMED